jgi:hypothetical protein
LEEEGVKSALELAMERISALPQLTPQEIEEQRRKENAPIGTAIAVRYLNGTLSDTELTAEINRHETEKQQIIRRALLSALCSEIRLGNSPQSVARSWQGMKELSLSNKGLCEAASMDFSRILEEFESVREQRLNKFGVLGRENLEKLGISGSAIRPNLNENEPWKEEMASLQRDFEPKLERLRNNLLEGLLRS